MLAFERIDGTAPTERIALFLHGILGRGSNLRTLAKGLVAARPTWAALLLDLRGHGASPKSQEGPSLAAAASDVLEVIDGTREPVTMLVGHSFGGKVALEALRQRSGDLAHVMTIDSPPAAREPERDADAAITVIEMLRTLPSSFPSRAAFADAVRAKGKTSVLAQWLAMSTELHDGKVRFALDLDEIDALIADYFATDLWPVVEAPPCAIHFVVGERSTAWSPTDLARARSLAARDARVTVTTLPTGHWVHAEDPEGLLRVLVERSG